MIKLTKQEAEDIRLAIKLGLMSCIRNENISDTALNTINEFMKNNNATRNSSWGMIVPLYLISSKLEQEQELEQERDISRIINRFEILDI